MPASHPLQVIPKTVNTALTRMQPLFSDAYEADVKGERPCVASEKLLRAMLLLCFGLTSIDDVQSI